MSGVTVQDVEHAGQVAVERNAHVKDIYHSNYMHKAMRMVQNSDFRALKSISVEECKQSVLREPGLLRPGRCGDGRFCRGRRGREVFEVVWKDEWKKGKEGKGLEENGAHKEGTNYIQRR
ncbi:hypothetical protein VNO78_34767 [Psophocarpus tetragonolobus]|uniref:Uncharacterized protein n=1 Tax=Psophocarpus tetragonolobus TaxID=3891 RepID=A0AAN9NNV8_PSOTE